MITYKRGKKCVRCGNMKPVHLFFENWIPIRLIVGNVLVNC